MTEQHQDLGWAVLELMGHRKLAGYVTEHGPLFRIDVYTEDPDSGGEAIATQLYAPAALYCITPVAKDIALGFAQHHQPTPVARWELPAPERERVDSQAAGAIADADIDDGWQ